MDAGTGRPNAANGTSRPVIVAGAGPAGLMAATEAALAGCPVVLLEKMPAPGRKLLITGSGRCNVTNACETAALTDHFFSGGRFLRSAFSRFSNRDLVRLLQEGGIGLIEEPEGKLFPASSKAADILAFLLRRATSAGVVIETGRTVQAVLTDESGCVTGVRVDGDDRTDGGDQTSAGDRTNGVDQTITGDRSGASIRPASAIILAMGGRSWPNTGSIGDGTRLAKALGHAIVPERPALVPLVLADLELRALQGLALRDIGLCLEIGGVPGEAVRGDLLFTHFGISGPAVLRLSRQLTDPWPAQPVQAVLDLLPGLRPEAADRALLDHLAAEPRRQVHNILTAWLPAAFTPHLLRLAGLPADLEGGRVSRSQRQQLLTALKSLRLTVSGSRGWREAIITAGGVDLKEVNPKTMASRLVRGLFFAGEMLDLDADTGGYNLQAAWSTGVVAGRSAAAYVLNDGNQADSLYFPITFAKNHD